MEAMDIESADAPDPIDVPLLAHQHHLIQQANLAIGGVAIIGGAAASAPVDVPDVLNPSLVKRKWSKIQKKIFSTFFCFLKDLEQYANAFTGMARINRMLFVADHCPSLRIDALLMALNYIKQHTHNVGMYQAVYQRLQTAPIPSRYFLAFFLRIKISWFFLQSKWTGRCASAANSALRSKLGRKTNERRRTKIGKTGHWS